MTKKKISNLFTATVVFYPLLLLVSVIGSLKLGDILMIAVCLLMSVRILLDGGKIRLSLMIMCWILYVCALFILQVIRLPLNMENVEDMAHYVFTMIIIACFVPGYFDKATGMKMLRILVMSNAVLIIIQYAVMIVFNIYILEKVPSFYGGTTRAYFDINHPRPFGLFAEPAAFAWTAVIYLALELFAKKKNSKTVFCLFVTAMAMILSKSATAIALLGFVCGIWFIKKMLVYKKGKVYFVVGILAFVLFVIVLIKSGGLNFFIEHIYNAELHSVSRGVTGRVGTLGKAFSTKEKGLGTILFGQGIVQLTEYYSGLGRQAVFWGYVGIVFNYSVCLLLLKKNRTGENMVIILACIYNSFAACMVGIAPLLWMPYVVARDGNCMSAQEKKRNVEVHCQADVI